LSYNVEWIKWVNWLSCHEFGKFILDYLINYILCILLCCNGMEAQLLLSVLWNAIQNHDMIMIWFLNSISEISFSVVYPLFCFTLFLLFFPWIASFCVHIFHIFTSVLNMQLHIRILNLKAHRTRTIQIIQLCVFLCNIEMLSFQLVCDMNLNCRFLLAIWTLMSLMIIWGKFSASMVN